MLSSHGNRSCASLEDTVSPHSRSIIPGILEREQEQSVVYGSIDFGKTVLTHPKYLELVSCPINNYVYDL